LDLNPDRKIFLQSQSIRFSSNTTGSGSGDGGDNNDKKDTQQSSTGSPAGDPFGVSFDDGDDLGNLGPASQLPPRYKRDAATGKLTGDIEVELTPEERELLTMDPYQHSKLILKRVVDNWDRDVEQSDGNPKAVDDFGRRVRLAKMALNVLGRSAKAQGAKSIQEDGTEFGRDKETGFTQHLTRQEFETFQKFMKEQHNTQVTEDDLPILDDEGSGRPRRRNPFDDDDIHLQGITDDDALDPDNPDLSLKWLTSRAKWEVSKKYGAEGPFDEMMPRDLNIKRIVNRKTAKILPRELLHHNNLALLRRYVSPAGQIMHRSRTRLGARDQRKIAKLIKRARNLGLIPHTGQFVIEDNGNIFEKDIHEDKPWEQELRRRGLLPPKEDKV